MDRSIPLLLIGLLFGGGIGFTLAAANGVTFDGHDHSVAVEQGHGGHGHGAASHHGAPLALPAGDGAPTLAVDVVPDPASGWNLHIRTTNFRYAPENASRAHRAGEGHAHVYVNGAKHSRVYGPWVHLDALPPGEVKVEVTLNSNDHRLLAVGPAPLRAQVMVRN